MSVRLPVIAAMVAQSSVSAAVLRGRVLSARKSQLPKKLLVSAPDWEQPIAEIGFLAPKHRFTAITKHRKAA